MPIIVFHGTDDETVNVVNGHQVISQWVTTNDWLDNGLNNDTIDDIANRIETENNYTRYIYYDKDNHIVMEKYIINNMTHAWSGGSNSELFADPNGLNQSFIIWEFFKNMAK